MGSDIMKLCSEVLLNLIFKNCNKGSYQEWTDVAKFEVMGSDIMKLCSEVLLNLIFKNCDKESYQEWTDVSLQLLCIDVLKWVIWQQVKIENTDIHELQNSAAYC